MYRRVFKLTTRRNIPEDSKLKSWLNSSWLFSVSAGKCRNITLKLGHDRFVPNPLQFIFHLSHFCLMVHSLSNWGSVVKKLQAEAHTKNRYLCTYCYHILYVHTSISPCETAPRHTRCWQWRLPVCAQMDAMLCIFLWDRIISRDLWS
jgi:hypothetical protein